jgi:hypothetical protein
MILRIVLASAILFTIPLNYATPANAQMPATTILRRGMDLPVKIGSTVSSDSVRAGATFYGTIPINLIDRGCVVLPAGTLVTLRVSEVDESNFGSSIPRLTLEAVSLSFIRDADTVVVPILTTSVSRSGQRYSGYGSFYPMPYMGQRFRSRPATFIPGDVIRISLSEDVLLAVQ